MKKVVCLMFVSIILGWSAKPDLTSTEKDAIKAKAEAVYVKHIQYMNKMMFDSAEALFSKDVYFVIDKERWSYDRLAKVHRESKRTLQVVEMKVDSMHSYVINREAVHVTAYFSMLTVDSARQEFYSKNIHSLIINPQLKKENILECIQSSDFPYVRYGENVPREFYMQYLNLSWRHNVSLYQYQIMWLYHTSVMKQQGISPAKSGEMMGETFVSSLDKSQGFDGFSNSLLFFTHTTWPRAKVLERNKDLIRIEYTKYYLNTLLLLKITDEDAVNSITSCWKYAAEYMGATTEVENRDYTFIVTFKRK